VTDVTVRAATGADASVIAAIYAPYVLETSSSFEEVAPDATEMLRRMTVAPRMPWLVAQRSTAVIGYAYASRHRARAAYRWSAECSIYLARDAAGHGLGRMLYERLFTEAAALGYVSMFAGVTLPNDASVSFHERMGFKPLGVFPRIGYKFGRWHDVAWYHRALRKPPAQPADPGLWEPENFA